MLSLRNRIIGREIQNWRDQGLIDAATAERLAARYSDGPGLGLGVLTGAALVFVALAVLLLVGANWDQWSRAVRLAVLFTATLAANGAGAWLLWRDWRGLRRHRASTALLFLGSVLYGASIMLIGQMYHLGEHFPNGLLLWMIGVLPVALITRGRLLALLLLALTLIWTFMEGRFTPPWAAPLFLAAVARVAQRRDARWLWRLTLAGGLAWLNVLLAWVYHTDFGPDWRAGHLTFNLAALALVLAWRRRAPEPVGFPLAERLLAPVLLALTFPALWRDYLDHHWGWLDPGLWAGLGLVVAALVAAPRAAAGWLGLAGLVLIHGLGRPEQAPWWAAVASLATLVLAALWLRRAVEEGDGRRFAAALATLVALALSRYLDLIGDYLGAAALFLVMAALLYGAAYYWKTWHRKKGRRE